MASRCMNETGLRALEPMGEMRFDGRPFAIENAIYTGIAQGAIADDLMLPEYPVQFRPQSLDGGTTLTIEEVGSEFHRNAFQPFECMAEHQQLALGIESGALDPLSIPGGADFHAPIGRIDIRECRHADRFIAENQNRA
jgi:hypothetical protein